MKSFLYFCINFVTIPLLSYDWIEESSREISGIIYQLRKKIESPKNSVIIYDLHFRTWNYHLKTDKYEFDLILDKSFDKNNFFIPVETQAYIHFSEAENLWNKNKKKEAIYIWKSLQYVEKFREISYLSTKKIEELYKKESNRTLIQNIDPFFLYRDKQNETLLLSDDLELKLKLPGYWNHIIDKKNEWFYFMYNRKDYKTFFLKSHSLILYFHIFYIKNRSSYEGIQFIDNFYSWNSNLKKEYNFQRKTINKNVYKVNYNLKNQFTSFYEIFFPLIYRLVYIRVYDLQKNGQNIESLIKYIRSL